MGQAQFREEPPTSLTAETAQRGEVAGPGSHSQPAVPPCPCIETAHSLDAWAVSVFALERGSPQLRCCDLRECPSDPGPVLPRSQRHSVLRSKRVSGISRVFPLGRLEQMHCRVTDTEGRGQAGPPRGGNAHSRRTSSVCEADSVEGRRARQKTKQRRGREKEHPHSEDGGRWGGGPCHEGAVSTREQQEKTLGR